MDIYLVRHGESTFNVNENDDMIDCPLTTNGIQQSININKSHYSLIVCSPLRRCIQTLKYSNLTSDHLEINDLFREIQTGFKSDLLNENEFIHIDNEHEIKQKCQKINSYLLEKKQLNLSSICIITHADLVWNLTSHQINGELFGTWLNNAEVFHWKQI